VKRTSEHGVAIAEVAGAGPELESVRELFAEYAKTPGVGQCVRDFARELAALPGAYAPPGGCLWLAELGGVPAGCVALRALDSARCEMKRLYVRAAFRGAGLAGILVECVIERARALGYRELYLDTLPVMRAARAMYNLLGFRPCPPYLPDPTPGADCLILDLSTRA
jgi:putative acetyltransferase